MGGSTNIRLNTKFGNFIRFFWIVILQPASGRDYPEYTDGSGLLLHYKKRSAVMLAPPLHCSRD